jgi:hypothetical protein
MLNVKCYKPLQKISKSDLFNTIDARQSVEN